MARAARWCSNAARIECEAEGVSGGEGAELPCGAGPCIQLSGEDYDPHVR